MLAGNKQLRRIAKFGDNNNAFRYLCCVKEISPGNSRQFTIIDGNGSEIEIAVFNVNGTFYAISNTCKHEGGPLSQGILKEMIVTCPWHGWKYSVVDGRAPHEGGDSVDSYETKVVKEKLYVSSIPNNLGKRVTQPHERYSNLKKQSRST